MEERGSQKGFGPLVAPGARALVLGSYPSPKSFEYGFFYGHPQNRFWPLLARLCGEDAPPTTIEEKTALVLRHGLALWDSIESCKILGASDASITDVVPNDIATLIAKTGIEAVFCNGAASHRVYQKFQYPLTGIEATKLPSTSPANAAFSPGRLYGEWQPIVPYIK